MSGAQYELPDDNLESALKIEASKSETSYGRQGSDPAKSPANTAEDVKIEIASDVRDSDIALAKGEHLVLQTVRLVTSEERNAILQSLQKGPTTGVTRDMAMHAPMQPSVSPSMSDQLETGTAGKPSPSQSTPVEAATTTTELVVRGFACFACAGFVAFVIAFGVTSMWWNRSSSPTATPAPAASSTTVPAACQFIGSKVSKIANGTYSNMTAEQMKAYLGTPTFTAWGSAHFSCIDGRHDDQIIATPGGDMGIFVSAAAVYIKHSARPDDFSFGRMRQLLSDFILRFRSPSARFYYHTDEHANAEIIKGLEEGGFDPSVLARPGAEVDPADDDFLPPPDMRALALNLSSTLKNFGCGHMRRMGQLPELYEIPSADLVINSVRALWDLKWTPAAAASKSIRVTTLQHAHTEEAVLFVKNPEGCPGMAPLITQRTAAAEGAASYFTAEVFVVHDDAAKAFQRGVADWFLTRPDANNISTPAFVARLNDLQEVQLHKTAEELARDRPFFSAAISGQTYTPDV